MADRETVCVSTSVNPFAAYHHYPTFEIANVIFGMMMDGPDLQ